MARRYPRRGMALPLSTARPRTRVSISREQLAGKIINNEIGSGDNGADGLSIGHGALVQGTGSADITLIGQGGSNMTSPTGAVTGSAAGVVINSKVGDGSAQDNGNTQVSTVNGNISITGTAGSSPDKGVGVGILAEDGSTTTVSSTTGTINISGSGGSGNTAGLINFGQGLSQTDLPNDGVLISGNSILQTAGAGGIGIIGTGQGANGAAIYVAQAGETIAPTLMATSGPLSLTTLSTGVGDIILTNDSVPATSGYAGTSMAIDTQGNGAVVLNNVNIQLNNAPLTINGASISADTSIVQSSYTNGVQVLGSVIDIGGALKITSTNGDIVFNADGTIPSPPTPPVAPVEDDAIAVDATSTPSNPTTASSVTFNSSNGIDIDSPLSSSNGAVFMQGATITLNAAITSTGGNIVLVDSTQS